MFGQENIPNPRFAALGIHALGELNRKPPGLVARVDVENGAGRGQATGEIFGDAPNLRARMQALAGRGKVLDRKPAAPGGR